MKKKNSKRNENILKIAIVALTVIVGIVLLYKYKPKHEEIIQLGPSRTPLRKDFPSPPPPKKPLLIQTCNGERYTDGEANFSILCPANFEVFVTRNEPTKNQRKDKQILLCEKGLALDDYGYSCSGASIAIWSNGDGWGGGCDQKDHTLITIGGETKEYCLGDTYFDQLYLGDRDLRQGKDRYYLSGSFSSTFPQAKVLEVLQTFQFSH